MRTRICRHFTAYQLYKTAVRRLHSSQYLPAPPHQPTLSRTSRTAQPSTSASQRRHASTTPKTNPDRIAILGGGISGLASAYYASRAFPSSKIVLYEGSTRLGGWIHSQRSEVEGGTVLFESGPRTLRPNPVTAHLVQELGLVADAIVIPRNHAAARNRYIYYPDTLNKLPQGIPSMQNVFALLRSGIASGLWKALVETRIPRRPDNLEDESVASWVSRRIDPRVADNIVSAIMHGIYAGDATQLSVKSILPLAWHLEGRFGSAFGGFWKMQWSRYENEPLILTHPLDLEMAYAIGDEIALKEEWKYKLATSSIYSFTDGLEMLVRRLEEKVKAAENVEIKMGVKVENVEYVEQEGEEAQVHIATSLPESGSPHPITSADPTLFDNVIATVPTTGLTPYVTVQTVTLYYPIPPDALLQHKGFGYLIPRSVPFHHNPEFALGVIFDSCALSAQDTAPGTKLTVMFGGHWWDGWTAYPSDEEAGEMAKLVVARHLGIKHNPTAAYVNLSQNCIPQYTLGYESRVEQHAEHVRNLYKGRLRVVGSQVNGVGVNDCVMGAWDAVRRLKDGGWADKTITGLERASGGDWVVAQADSVLGAGMARVRTE